MLSQPSIEPSAETLTDIRHRLGPVCQNYSDEEFAVLVRQIACVQAKYEVLRTEHFIEATRRLASDVGRPRASDPRGSGPHTSGEPSWR
jgi:hypothetical protein